MMGLPCKYCSLWCKLVFECYSKNMLERKRNKYLGFSCWRVSWQDLHFGKLKAGLLVFYNRFYSMLFSRSGLLASGLTVSYSYLLIHEYLLTVSGNHKLHFTSELNKDRNIHSLDLKIRDCLRYMLCKLF